MEALVYVFLLTGTPVVKASALTNYELSVLSQVTLKNHYVMVLFQSRKIAV